ncbi:MULTISPECIES: LCP family protein [unclassified Pseudoclavibacter]|uniref:LCP family protein n=1 Tax=unclassified Pseudoclavibacter TaxID=2615177 RepID=UPI0015CEE740|nr:MULTISPECIES: LCP family protein [unclassified Pseudoclavibacter]MBS3180129.1 LCP family protein [Pseudoclavibacter sp. Marseille-Q4354]NYF12738.1 LCP family protein required for cell wall assembly [Pseudoclavibacter sp. JAI123]
MEQTPGQASSRPRSDDDALSDLFEHDAAGSSDGTRRGAREDGKKKRRGPKILLWTLVGILVAAVAGAGIVWWNVQSRIDAIETFEGDPGEYEGRPEQVVTDAGEPVNILLLGSDSRAPGSPSIMTDLGSRSDTMMLVHIPADRSDVQIMSIMRDSWLAIPGHGEAKINAALSFGGVPLVVQTVEGLLGQRINHVAVVDFDGFAGITDALGGVTINNDVAFNSSHMKGKTFEAGPITLTGEEALAFVRERYAFTDGDYQRVRNQQAWLKAVLDKMLSAETLTDPGKINNIITQFTPYVGVSDSLDLTTMANLGFSMRDIRGSNVRSFTLPTNGTGMVGDQSVVFLDTVSIADLKQHLAADTVSEYQPTGR